jgi:hypothetical protein
MKESNKLENNGNSNMTNDMDNENNSIQFLFIYVQT